MRRYLVDVLALHAQATPDRVAVIDDRPGLPVLSWTFAELNQRAAQLAHLFRELGAGFESKVVTVGQNSAAIIAATHAVRKSGAVNVPLNYRLTAEEAAYVVDNCDATIVYVDADYRGLIDTIRPHIPKVRHIVVFDLNGALTDPVLAERLAGQPVEDPEIPESEQAGVGTSMIYTSGTTGRPKGAVRPAGGGSGLQMQGLVELIGYGPSDVYITTGPLYHSGPGGFAALTAALGATVVVQHKFDAEDWLRLVDTYKVTTTFTAPTPIRMICTLAEEVKARYDRSSMARLVANAAPWTLALKKLYLADFPTDSLWEVYGSTELGVDCVLGPDDHLRKPGSCGRPAPGVEIILLDDDRNLVTGSFANGELFVRAESMFSQYYKAQDKYEADRFGDYHTVGDIAYRDDEGFYYIADRKKDMIISGGMNIYPAEIEAALDASPEVYEVAVFGIPSEQWGESVHAVVVPARPDATAESIMAFARDHLAGYKLPRSVTFVDELPKTGSGKVLKRELRAPWWESARK
jgi:acyl-CoA synthetase (AMP-forming)/AMP-acid ligase II